MSVNLTQQMLRIQVEFQGHPDMQVPITLYAFRPDGTLAASAPVRNGQAELPLPPQEAALVSLLVAPTMEHDLKPTLKLIERMMPYKPVWNYTPGKLEYKLLPVPEQIARHWLGIPTRVIGRVVAEVPYLGRMVEVPVPDAKVTVMEVDPVILYLNRIPNFTLLKLRDELARAVEAAPREQSKRLLPNLPMLRPEPVESLRAMPVEAFRDWLVKAVQTIPQRMDLLKIISRIIVLDKQKVLELVTDQDGRFDGTFRFWPFQIGTLGRLEGDAKPDLCFKVEFEIGGVMTTIYETGDLMNTLWNFEGQPVTLRVQQAPVYPAPSFLQGDEVAVVTLGNYVNIAEMKNGLTADGAPLAGVVEPHVIFGTELAKAGAMYRWSYKKRETDEPWRVIDAPVDRHYVVTEADGTMSVKTMALGPVVIPEVGKCFHVQPLTPPAGRWAPEMNARANTASAFFKTREIMGADVILAAGLYDLKLEVFDKHGKPIGVDFRVPAAGQPIDLEQMVPPDIQDGHQVVTENGKAIALLLPVMIDNNPCVANIPEPTVDGHTAGDECGIIAYTPAPTGQANARITFQAYHPHGYSTFRFDLLRGRKLIEQVEPGQIVTTMPDHAYSIRSGGLYTATLNTADLLGTCKRAVFTESLHVWATATDGWNRQSHLDCEAMPVGFALDPRT